MTQKLMKQVKKLVKTCIFLLKMSKKVKNLEFLLIICEKNKNFIF